MGNLQRSSTTGNLLKHDATGNLMNVCCCSRPLYSGRIEYTVVRDIAYTYVSGDPELVPTDSTDQQIAYTKNAPVSSDPYFWTTRSQAGGTGALYGSYGEATVPTPPATTVSFIAWGGSPGVPPGSYWPDDREFPCAFRSSGCPYGSWARLYDDPTIYDNGGARYTQKTTYTITADEE